MTDPREDALAKPITDERIERVAKALCRNAYPDRNLGEYVSPDVQIWERLKREARIALEADSKALTPTPTPYVRPAAEIRAEIERVSAKHGSMTARVVALTWTLTPPTQEPR